MRQFASVLISLVLLPIFLKKKINIGVALLAIGAIVASVGGLEITVILMCFASIFTQTSTLQTLAVVLEIGVLCTLMKNYGFLSEIEISLKKFLTSRQAIIMMLPAIIGIMQVPGGAAISAPFANTVGEELGMTQARRSAVNVIFRHVSMFFLPFSSSIILTTVIIPQVQPYSLISLTMGFMLCFYFAAYITLVRGTNAEPLPRATIQEKADSAKKLLYFLSPIYMVVILNGVFTLPLYLSVFICILWTGLLAHDKGFFTNAAKGINLNTLLMLIGVYFFQNIIKSFKEMLVVFSGVFQSAPEFVVLLLIAGMAIIFGATTGLNLVPLGIILPIIASMNLAPDRLLLYAFFIYIWSILGYFYSPLHLCQMLTNQCIGCDYMQSFKEHLRLIPFVVPMPFVLFYLYSFIVS